MTQKNQSKTHINQSSGEKHSRNPPPPPSYTKPAPTPPPPIKDKS